jgi:hypothetical protein
VRLRPTLTVRTDDDAADVLRALFAINVGQIRHRMVPPLYESGVRYAREPRGVEEWNDAVTCFVRWKLRRVGSDCEDLACWRAAELVALELDPGARPMLRDVRPGLKHAVVLRGDGSIEDPSRRLGMGGG